MYQNLNTYSTGCLNVTYILFNFERLSLSKLFLCKELRKLKLDLRNKCSLKIAHRLMYIKYNKAKNYILCND
jgi:hypothetical protein